MARLVVLDNVEHKGLRVSGEYSVDYGHGVGCVQIFPTEFVELQREYPILLQQIEGSSGYRAVALLGFSEHENLFLQNNTWGARYLPALIAKGPFFVGYEDDSIAESVVMVDLDDPRVNERVGNPLFLEFGGDAACLVQIKIALDRAVRGGQIAENIYNALAAANLIQPLEFEVTLDQGNINKVVGFYTIDRDKFYSLSGAQLQKLNSEGALEAAVFIMSSLGNVRRLIDIKNNQNRA